MKVLVVDDEADARARLRRLLGKHPEITVAGEAADGLDALEKIEALRPDLVFLDIEMPGLGGLDVVRSLPAGVPLPLFIFATGFDQHALQAFELNALAYLLKPVEPERLAHALERARLLSDSGAKREAENRNVVQAARHKPAPMRRLVCRSRERMVLMPVEQIVWFRVEDGEVKASAATECFHVNFGIGELEASLPRELFFRARRVP